MNILTILIDDLGWADLSCYGSSFYETPNLDRLAARGVRFTDGYASAPVCSPTRAAFETGRYPARVGITNYIRGNAWGKLMGVPYFHALPKDEVTIAQMLAPSGYARHRVGKWHLGKQGNTPEDFGYETNIGGSHQGHPPSFFSPYGLKNLPDGPEGEYLTDRITDEAIGLLERHGGPDPADPRPFFMNLSHYAVHTPIQAPEPLVAKYRAKAKRMGLDPADALVEGEALPVLHMINHRVTRRVVQSDPVYAAMVENLDHNLGRLFDALEQLGLIDETLILFTSDNGGLSSAEGSPTCNAPLLEGKGWMYDGGNRVCFIAAGPGVAAQGTTCDTPISTVDVLPTVLESAGVPRPEAITLDGDSLVPLLNGEELPERAIHWHYPHYSNQGGTPACAIRRGDFKLLELFEERRIELYDLKQDPGESNNLAPSEPGRAAALHAELVAWRREIEAKIPEVNPYYEAVLNGNHPRPDGHGQIPGDDHDYIGYSR